MEEISQKDDLVIPNEPGCLMTEVVLKTQEAGKSYTLKRKRVQALKNVTLEIKRGEFVAIMGNSGSGKTSLLSMLGCLDRPSTGKVFVDGICVSEMRDSHLFKIRRDKIGFVFQSYNLLPYLNARENVQLAMESTKKSKMERSVRALELLAAVGLSGKEEHRPQQLSGGEQQRVAIARALANNPSVILADELTGNLDGTTKNEIMKLLINLNLMQGTTIVVVTHDKELALQTERILRLKDGRIEKEYRGNLAKRKEQIRNQRLNAKEEEVAKSKLVGQIGKDIDADDVPFRE